MIAAAPFAALVAVVVGILVGEASGPGAAWGAVLAAGIALATALVGSSNLLRVGAVVVACGSLATASMERSLHGLAQSPLRAAVAERVDITARGVLVDDPDATRWSAEALVRLVSWSSAGAEMRAAGGRRVLASASGTSSARLSLLAAGEGISVDGWLEPLSGFDARAKWKHAVATLHVTEVSAVEHAHTPLMRFANRARAIVLDGSGSLAPVDRAVLAGFLLGDTRAVPPEVEEQFRAAGLTHLMAVSGGNVAFVLALISPLLRRFRLGGRMLGACVVLVVFGTMTRWEPSVARAIAMTAIGLLAGYLGRPTAGLRALVLAAIVLLLLDPFLLHSVGFLLSCSASLGIALWAQRIAERVPGPRWLGEILGVTAAAQLGVAPILVPVFGSLPLVALPANLLAVPLAAPLTMWGMVAGLVSTAVAPFAPSVPNLLAVPTAALVHALLAVADLGSRVPIELDGRAIWAVIAIVALLVALHRTRSLRRDARPLPAR